MSIRNDIMQNLIDQAQGLTTGAYDINFARVQEYEENFLTTYTGKGPLLMIVDSGAETLLVDDPTDQRFSVDVDFVIFVQGDSWPNTRKRLNQAEDAILEFVNNGPSLGTNALDIIYQNGLGTQWDPNNKRALKTIRTNLIYYRTKDTSEAVGTDVDGTDWLGTAHGYLVTDLTTLKTDVASNDPTFSYVYNTHRKAAMNLNAVTVQLTEGQSDIDASYAGGQVINHRLTFSVRVHTAYNGGTMDTAENRRLLNGIVNQLYANTIQGGDYRIMSVTDLTVAETWEDSATMGAECIVTVYVPIRITRE